MADMPKDKSGKKKKKLGGEDRFTFITEEPVRFLTEE